MQVFNFNFMVMIILINAVFFGVFYVCAYALANILGDICSRSSSLEPNLFMTKEKKFLSLISFVISILLLFFIIILMLWYIGTFTPIFSDELFGEKTTSQVITSLLCFLFFTIFYILIVRVFNQKMLKIKQIFCERSRNNKREYLDIIGENTLYLKVSKLFYIVPIAVFIFDIF